MRERARLTAEITLRNVPPLDEIVFFVRDWIERLELELRTAARCTVTVGGFRREDGRRCYGVSVRVVGAETYAICEIQGTDLFHTLNEGFAAVRAELHPGHSGIIRRAVLDQACADTQRAPISRSRAG